VRQGKNVLATVEGEVLRQGQRDPRREQSLNAWRIGEGKEHDSTGQRPRFPEVADEEFRHVMFYAHGGEDYGEFHLFFEKARLADNLR